MQWQSKGFGSRVETGEGLIVLTNPKTRDNIYGKADWYPYYAGYAQGFVSDIIKFLKICPGQIIVDPWNGSGTTTQVATENGIQSYGFDINPVMIAVAQAKLLFGTTPDFLINLSSEIVQKASSYSNRFDTVNDPLNKWFNHHTIRAIRKINLQVQKEILQDNGRCDINSLRSFFQVALFRTLKPLLGSFKSSNPTWIKTAKCAEERLAVSSKKINKLFLNEVQIMSDYFNKSASVGIKKTLANVRLGDSTRLDLISEFADHIITSPPYCTRIDYIVATLPELSLLSPGYLNFNDLRKRMVGTNLIQNLNLEWRCEWGEQCKAFLEQVVTHAAKASKTYYIKIFLQYFNSFYCSLTELNRILKVGGTCTIVVQSSYYKNVLIDIPSITKEMANNLGLVCIYELQFNNAVSFSHVNSGSLKYKKATAALETVLIFRKRG